MNNYDCNKCLYNSCCEFGLTHHPNEMCQKGTSWRDEPITIRQKQYIDNMQEFSPYPLPVFDGFTKGAASDYISKYQELANSNEWAIENGYV